MRRSQVAVWLLAFGCFFASFAFAIPADPVPVENPVPGTSFAEVKLDLGKGDSVIWEVSPEPTKATEHKAGETAILHFNGPPGSYTVTAYVVNFDAKTFTKKKITVAIQGAQPPPGPSPGPNPNPNPQPLPGKISKFVVVEDTTQAGSWRGDVLGSPKVASFYKASGLSHRLIDVKADGDDAAAVAFKKLAEGKPLPYLWCLDADGKILKDQKCPTEADAFIAAFETHAGPRALGAKLEKPRLKWEKFGESARVPLIPRDKWKPVNLETFLPAVYDQDGIGQCASSSACTVLEACRYMAGLSPVHVSAGDLYSRVNGGRDQGSLPEDNLAELLASGVAPASMVPYVWDRRRHNDAATVAARKPNRIAEAYLCDSFDAMASALQQGFLTQIAIWWFDNFTPDANGKLPNQGRGGRGGHALMAYGLVKLPDGSWALLVRNSWGPGWGNSKDGTLGAGNCIIPESLFSFEFGSVWACRAVYQSGSNFPAPKLSLAEPKRDLFRTFEREIVLAP
jgi:hypothetical protein